MGKNIFEKLISKAAGGKEIKAGETLWLTPDIIALVDSGWRSKLKLFKQIGLERIQKPEKVVGVIDHCTEQLAVPEGAENNKVFRDFAKANGITKFHDVGKGGMMVQVLAEQYILPGQVGLVNDPEAEACNALGAFCFFGDTSLGMITDQFIFEVPEFAKCTVTGKFQKGVMSTDLKRKLLGDLGSKYGKYIEFDGPTIDEMSIDERMNLCILLYMCGSKGIIAADDKVVEYMKARRTESFEVVKSDPDAEYADYLKYDVTDLEPQISCPPTPNNVKGVSELKGIKINAASIGSCASGRMDDLRIAAEILKGKKVHEDVRLTIAPCSQEIMSQTSWELAVCVPS